MSGISRISQQEIAAYQHNHQVSLNSFELEILELFDSIFIEIFSKER